MKLTTRIVSIIVALLMVMPILVACKDKDKDKNVATTTVSTQEGVKKQDNLPDGLDFDGEEVKIMYRYYTGDFDTRLYESEGSLEGNDLAQAVYNRNLAVENRLNVDIVFEAAAGDPDQSTYTKLIQTMIMSSDTESGIDVYAHSGRDAANNAISDYFRSVNDLSYIELDQPYWYKDQMKSVSFNENDNYLLIGELSLGNYANMTAMFFNKDMYDDIYANEGKDYNALYDMVEAGDWTYENYFQICADAYADEGNGFKDIEDSFGSHFESSSGRTNYYPYTSGLNFSTRDADGFIQLNFDNDQTIAFVEKLYSLFHENQGIMDMTMDEARATFLAGQKLFHPYFLSHGAFIQASAEFEYGVVPFPKFEKELDYATAVLTGAPLYVLPKFFPDESLEVVGATLEALCSETYVNVSYEYFEVICKVKQAGGERDSKMIDLIRESLKTDFTFWCGPSIGNPTNLFKDIVVVNGSKDFSSYWGTNGDKYQGQLDALIIAYKEARA